MPTNQTAISLQVSEASLASRSDDDSKMYDEIDLNKFKKLKVSKKSFFSLQKN